MKYDPIKRTLGTIFNRKPFLRKLFYRLLDLLLLRTWHIKKEVRNEFKTLKQPINILDAGSGFGQYVYFLSNITKTSTIKGVDVKEEQIEDCRNFFQKINKKNVVFEYCDLTQFNETEIYNFVLSVDVMEHIEEDVLVFKNIYNSLKTNGVLLISTPSDQGGSDVHEHEEESFIEEHVRDGYNINDIEDKLKSVGFSKIVAKYSYGRVGHISWVLSMKYPILMVGYSRLFFIILPIWYIIFFPFCLILNYLDVRIKQKKGTGLIVKAYK